MKTLRTPIAACIVAIVALQAVTAGAAMDAIIKIQGSKQGQFKGDSKRDSFADTVTSFVHGVTRPKDYNAAAAAGHKVFEPIGITMKLDAGSKVPWAAALVTNETLSTVVLTFFKASPVAGAPSVAYMRITLTNATVVKLDTVARDPSDTSPVSASDLWTRVTLDFQKILVENIAGSTTASDDWLTPTT
jgi:type VI secretion system Hcp family effector